MDRLLAKLFPLLAACSCPDRLVVRSPQSLAGTTVPNAPSKEECVAFCGPHVTSCRSVPLVDEAPEDWSVKETGYTIECNLKRYCPGGRRPAGLDDGIAIAGGLGAHFAELARLEAASVHAFVELARELELHGAPHALVLRALRAAADEVTHARIAGALARAYDTEPIAPIVTPTPPRPLADVLVENAVEGLVYERYGATLAAVRAVRARSPAVRHAMQAIAIDEASHADLSSEIHAWGASRITRAARGRIRDAHEVATHTLRRDLDIEPSAALAAAGMPSATLAMELVA